jgi:hypothetical protein
MLRSALVLAFLVLGACRRDPPPEKSLVCTSHEVCKLPVRHVLPM